MTGDTRLAIFVGGKSARMGTAKGLLATPGGGPPILERLVRLGIERGLDPLLVGNRSPYLDLAVVATVPSVADDPVGAGPLGGLRAALYFARAQGGVAHLIAVACDMPFVNAEALQALSDAEKAGAVVAPRRADDAPWEPMLARYRVDAVIPPLDALLKSGGRSFQRLFESLDVRRLASTEAVQHALQDWDTPADVVP
ncbi:MAG: molybdenum cofactor guanylyltransferase [Polyangiales bacterium]